MSEIECPVEIALFSKDGKHWETVDGQTTPISWSHNESVTKIVIGESPIASDDDESKLISTQLPANFATLYPNLTHLHLWKCDFEQLPELPGKLKCLDLRGCRKLRELPSLPDTITVLDLGECARFEDLPTAPPTLQRFFVNNCSQLDADVLNAFWLALRRRGDGSNFVEFVGSRCPAVVSIKHIPRSLRRLELHGCENLIDVQHLGEFQGLQHLNLSSCPKLREIVDIPGDLQYVSLHGSDELQRFKGQDIGPYERGTPERPNVAKTLYSRRKFGGELATSAHAKLLLLGDGRVGKTTLSKRLQWDCLSADQQRNPDYEHLRPGKEAFTHGVRFSLWNTKLQLQKETAADLNARAASTGLTVPPCDISDTVDGSVRIWDFGGQELYHQTHRLFASEGSVFLILWNQKEIDPAKLRSEKPKSDAISDEEWVEQNRRRPLDYWIDYVLAIRPNAKIALVCTQVPAGSACIPWTNYSTKHASLDLPCFYIDSLDDHCSSNNQYQNLLMFIRRECGTEAARIGIIQPAYYSEVANYVDGLLKDNDDARRTKSKSPEHLLLPRETWNACLQDRHKATRDSHQKLNHDDISTITGYLHDAGHLFELRDPVNPAVMIDQKWAIDLIYELLRPPMVGADNAIFSLFETIRRTGGYFTTATLNEVKRWRELESETERRQILSYMEECAIIVRLLRQDDSVDGRDYFLATEKWLLPEYGTFQQFCETRFQIVADLPFGSVIEEFKFEEHQISEFEFRTLMAHLGKLLPIEGTTWFRNGLQSVDKALDPSWCFEVRWQPVDEAGFLGVADARLTTPQPYVADLSKQIEDVFAANGSPFSRYMTRLRRVTQAPDDLAHCFFRKPNASDFDLAVSSTSADRAIVEPLVSAMKADGMRVNWYELPECRTGEEAKVLPFMQSLNRQPCILLFLSDSYLRNDPVGNPYCIWEIASAIRQMVNGSRRPERTLVVYRKGGNLTSQKLDAVCTYVLRAMAEHFQKRYSEKRSENPQNRITFAYFDEWSRLFDDAADNVYLFHQQRGNLGEYSRYDETSNGIYDFSKIIRDLRKAIGREKAGM